MGIYEEMQKANKVEFNPNKFSIEDFHKAIEALYHTPKSPRTFTMYMRNDEYELWQAENAGDVEKVKTIKARMLVDKIQRNNTIKERILQKYGVDKLSVMEYVYKFLNPEQQYPFHPIDQIKWSLGGISHDCDEYDECEHDEWDLKFSTSDGEFYLNETLNEYGYNPGDFTSTKVDFEQIKLLLKEYAETKCVQKQAKTIKENNTLKKSQ